MPLKRLLCSAALAAATLVCHAEESRTWRFTATELAAALEGKMASQVRGESMQTLFSSAYGQAYIVGIATRPKAGCGALALASWPMN
ncbi:hypothetical protein [Cupriavidus necator]|uniref:hypothetical protein n=1 Tax=Cupriavidus necator TaxID=106590 RepID=UPI00339D9DD7